MYPSIEIFGREFGTYGIMTLLGLLACLLVGSRLIRRYEIDIYDFALVMIAVAVGLVAGAVLVYGLSNIRLIIAAFMAMGKIGFGSAVRYILSAFGGMVFYGGFIGGGIALLVYTKYKKDMRLHRDHLLDIYGVLTPLFHAFGRVGCFLGGCCYGVESAIGFTTYHNTVNPSINGVNRFPIQLVESGCNVLIFLLLLYFFRKRILHERLIYVYMLIYPVVRFVDEFFRGDTYRGLFFGLSTSQWISICLFVFALIMLPLKTRRMKAAEAKEQEI